MQLAPCCQPIPGDRIIGQLKRDQGLIVHTEDCEVAKRLSSKEAGHWTGVVWGENLNRRFDCRIKLLVQNERGILARVAAEINESDANIIHVLMDQEKYQDRAMIHLRFTIQVENRIHLARMIRNVRRLPGVERLERERG